MQDLPICIKCEVSGKVHGVWFRAGTKDQAASLGLTGWVRNLPDGRVAVMACGNKSTVLALVEWLKRGPELAEVSEVIHREVPFEKFERFAILR